MLLSEQLDVEVVLESLSLGSVEDD